MTTKIILTVAIPTFNGAGTIARTLESVCSQLSPGVEVLVCDNCSTDETMSVVRQFMSKYGAVRCHTNEKNCGYDRNVDISMHNAHGDFVWLLGDDDVILPDGISTVLRILNDNPGIVALFANCPHEIKIEAGHGGLCTGGDDFFRKTRFKSGFMSTNVFNRASWLDVDISKYFGTGWVHLGFLLEVLNKFPSYIEPRLCVDYIRSSEAKMRWGGSGSFLNTGLQLVRMYEKMPLMGYSQETQRNAYMSVRGGYWRNICLAKAKGFSVTPRVLKDFFDVYKGFPSFWFMDLPLLLCPGVIFRALFVVYRLSVASLK